MNEDTSCKAMTLFGVCEIDDEERRTPLLGNSTVTFYTKRHDFELVPTSTFYNGATVKGCHQTMKMKRKLPQRTGMDWQSISEEFPRKATRYHRLLVLHGREDFNPARQSYEFPSGYANLNPARYSAGGVIIIVLTQNAKP